MRSVHDGWDSALICCAGVSYASGWATSRRPMAPRDTHIAIVNATWNLANFFYAGDENAHGSAEVAQ